jgi:hypothetical protein
MGNALEKIELRIILLCKENDINFDIQRRENEIIYSFENHKLGIITVKVQLIEGEKLDKVFIYGSNDELLKIADRIEQDEKLFGLLTDSYILSREDYQNTNLEVTFDRSAIETFEDLNERASNLNLQRNILTDKVLFKKHKTAYNKNYNINDIVLPSKKFYRPEHYYLKFDEDSLPDENGNINCFFCVDCKNCENCIGCIGCTGCNHCTNCINCKSCYHCYDSVYCSECDSCVECNGCAKCLFCDGMIARSHLGSYCIYSDGFDRGISSDITLFPDTGSVLYHDKIESFLLINHFVPYHRPNENATNYNWHIQWRMTRDSRRYWITEQPTKIYYAYSEISMFLLMNKLQYQNWELEDYLKECFNIPKDGSIISNVKPFIDKILIPKQNESKTIWDEIKTKIPSECIYNDFLYEFYNK